MSNKDISLLVLFIFLITPAFASQAEWNEGIIILNSEEWLEGEINYNSNLDIIQYRTSRSIKAYSAFNVKSFHFFDKNLAMEREFKTVEININSCHKRAFYEVVLVGQVTLLRKKNPYSANSKETKNAVNPYLFGYNYFAYNNKELIDLRKFRKKILSLLMNDYGLEINKFIEENDLKVSRLKDQILITDYYNSIKDPSYASYFNIESL